jgi:carbon storage regulator
MLVLTRRLGEEIVIDGSISVRIISVANGKVRVGVDAPDSVSVDRREIYERRMSFRRPQVTTSEPSQPILGARIGTPPIQ